MVEDAAVRSYPSPGCFVEFVATGLKPMGLGEETRLRDGKKTNHIFHFHVIYFMSALPVFSFKDLQNVRILASLFFTDIFKFSSFSRVY